MRNFKFDNTELTVTHEDEKFTYFTAYREGYKTIKMKECKQTGESTIANLNDFAKDLGYSGEYELMSDDRVLDFAIEKEKELGVFIFSN